ncbi:MAG: helix-turn-helix domain-containing protein, partial [Phenylobacterium sp.]
EATAPSTGRSAQNMPSAGGVTLFEANGHMRTLEAIEADVIRLAIGHYRGRMTEVARRLGIGRSTLYRKLGELGIDHAA